MSDGSCKRISSLKNSNSYQPKLDRHNLLSLAGYFKHQWPVDKEIMITISHIGSKNQKETYKITK